MPSFDLLWMSHTSVRHWVNKSMTGILSGASILGSLDELVSFLCLLPFNGQIAYVSGSVEPTGYGTTQKIWYATWRKRHCWPNRNSGSKTRSLAMNTPGKWEYLSSHISTCRVVSLKGRGIWNPTNKIFIPQGKLHSITMNCNWDFQNSVLEVQPDIIQRTGLIQ